jgi:DNA repair ATPase RecN
MLEVLQNRALQWQGRFSSVKEDLDSAKEKVEAKRTAVNDTKGAISLLQYVAAEISKANEKQTADLATIALRETFPDQELTLLVEHHTHRGHPAIEFKLRDEKTGAEGDPMDRFGGGPASVIGVVLQVLCTVRQPGMVRTLILDEPLSQVSSRYEKLAGRFLRKLCEPPPEKEGETGGLGFKMLVVTHSGAIAEAAHKRYFAKKTEDGKALELSLTQETEDE